MQNCLYANVTTYTTKTLLHRRMAGVWCMRGHIREAWVQQAYFDVIHARVACKQSKHDSKTVSNHEYLVGKSLPAFGD